MFLADLHTLNVEKGSKFRHLGCLEEITMELGSCSCRKFSKKNYRGASSQSGTFVTTFLFMQQNVF